MRRSLKVLAGLALFMSLAACGGGGDTAPVAADPLAEVPASASQSSVGMTDYMSVLAAMQSDTRDPVVLDSFSPPKPDDTDPQPVTL